MVSPDQAEKLPYSTQEAEFWLGDRPQISCCRGA